jgi:outer membrane protein OmpA-like peptidoglycan-associated protein
MRSILLPLFILFPILAYGQQDTSSIYFKSAVTELNATQKGQLDQLLYTGKISANAISVVGYADQPGTSALNDAIANRRAAAVKAYLLQSGLKPQQILQCIGKGNFIRSGEDIHQRRVDIVSTRLAAGAPTAGALPDKSDTGLYVLGHMRPDEVLVLEGLQFELSNAAFRPESFVVLKNLVQVLRKFPLLKLSIEGHICCAGAVSKGTGQQDSWYRLSVDRAQAVYTYLFRHGISADRLSFKGLGFTKPRAYPERTEEDKFLNRRVELRVVSNK